MRALLATLLLLGAGAGCIGGDTSPDGAVDPASTGPTAETTATDEIEVYAHSDLVVGASPPADPGPGPLNDQIPIALVETFEVPEGAIDIDVRGDLCGGSGAGRIEIVAPDGTLVFSTPTYYLVGAPQVGCVGVDTGTPAADDVVMPGTYEVRYYIAGAYMATVTVEAEVPAGAA